MIFKDYINYFPIMVLCVYNQILDFTSVADQGTEELLN